MPSTGSPDQDGYRLLALIDDLEEALARCFGWTEEVLLAKPLLALRDFRLTLRTDQPVSALRESAICGAALAQTSIARVGPPSVIAFFSWGLS